MAAPGQDLVEHAQALAPLLRKHAEEAEQLRQPHDAVISALEASGIFELMVPRCYGGRELDVDTFLDPRHIPYLGTPHEMESVMSTHAKEVMATLTGTAAEVGRDFLTI